MRRFPENDFSFEGFEVGFWTGETWAAETDEMWRPAVGLYGVTLEREHFADSLKHFFGSIGRYFWGASLAFLKRSLRNRRCAVLHAHGEMRSPIAAEHQQYVRAERGDGLAWYYEDEANELHPTQRWVDAREQDDYGLIVVLACCELGDAHPKTAPVLTKHSHLVSSLQESSAYSRNREPNKTYFGLFAPGGQMLPDHDIGATENPPRDLASLVQLRLLEIWDKARR